MPQDVAKVLSKNYGKITTSNKVKSSITLKVAPNPIDVMRNITNTTVLTFKQSEKKRIKAVYPDREIMTVHEAEGITRKKVALVRLDIADNQLYMSNDDKLNPHQLVGISRCTEELLYVTVKADFLTHALTNLPKVNNVFCNANNRFLMTSRAFNYEFKSKVPAHYVSQLPFGTNSKKFLKNNTRQTG